MKSFEIKTRIFFGEQALDHLKELPYRKVLIITDPFVVQSRMIDLITAPLIEAKIDYDIFKDVVPDPPIEKISEGVRKLLEYRPEAIVAVGGGSAIDSSKSIREFALKVDDYGSLPIVGWGMLIGGGLANVVHPMWQIDSQLNVQVILYLLVVIFEDGKNDQFAVGAQAEIWW